MAQIESKTKAYDPADVESKDDYGVKASREIRRRAPVACHNCHLRKIRCDVAVSGFPCSHCNLDNEECAISKDRKRGR